MNLAIFNERNLCKILKPQAEEKNSFILCFCILLKIFFAWILKTLCGLQYQGALLINLINIPHPVQQVQLELQLDLVCINTLVFVIMRLISLRQFEWIKR